MTKFMSAKIKTNTFSIKTPYVVKENTGHTFKDWVFNKMWPLFFKWGNVKQHIEHTKIEIFDFTESKKKLVSERILEEMQKRQRYYDEHMMPDKYVIIMGEDTFFDIVDEKRDNSPFLGDTMSFMSNDLYYNDPYYGRRTHNFSCHIVKGMQGFAFVPKVLIERNR